MRCALPIRGILPLAFLLGTACSVPRLNIGEKECPCAAGWTCDTRANVCVRGDGDPRDLEPADDAGRGARPEPPDAATDPDVDSDSATPYPADGGTSDAPDAAASACEHLPDTHFLHDGFEVGQSGFRYFSYGTGSNLDVQYTAFSHSGERSLRAETTSPGRSASANHSLEDPITDCTFYLSTYLFVEASVDLRSFSVLSVGDQLGQAIRLLYTQQGLQLHIDATSTTLFLDPKVEVIGRWVQFEMEVDIGVEGEVRVYLDGKQAGTLIVNTERPLGYSQIRMGVVSSVADQGPIVLFADDFLLARFRPAASE